MAFGVDVGLCGLFFPGVGLGKFRGRSSLLSLSGFEDALRGGELVLDASGSACFSSTMRAGSSAMPCD